MSKRHSPNSPALTRSRAQSSGGIPPTSNKRKTWDHFTDTVFLVILELALQSGLSWVGPYVPGSADIRDIVHLFSKWFVIAAMAQFGIEACLDLAAGTAERVRQVLKAPKGGPQRKMIQVRFSRVLKAGAAPLGLGIAAVFLQAKGMSAGTVLAVVVSGLIAIGFAKRARGSGETDRDKMEGLPERATQPVDKGRARRAAAR